MAKEKDDKGERVLVHVLVSYSLMEEFDMPRGRKPGSKNKDASVNGKFVVTIGEGGAGKNRVTDDPVGTALGLISNELPLAQLSARKMDKVFTLETRMVPKTDAEKYALPDIVILQPAADEKSEEIRGRLNEVLAKLDKTRKFYGVGDEVFGFTMQLVEEKSGKKKTGRPRKVKDETPVATPTASATV